VDVAGVGLGVGDHEVLGVSLGHEAAVAGQAMSRVDEAALYGSAAISKQYDEP
jgi:hypothetical protein